MMELFTPTVTAALLASAMSAGAAEDVVRDIMMLEVWSIAAISEYGETGPFTPDALEFYFTEGFAESYDLVMGHQDRLAIPLIDGDPITGSQEYCPLWDVQIGDASVNQETAQAYVTVTFQSYWCFPEAGDDIAAAVTEVVFDLNFVEKRWRIADFAVNGESFQDVLIMLEGEGAAEAARNLPPAP